MLVLTLSLAALTAACQEPQPVSHPDEHGEAPAAGAQDPGREHQHPHPGARRHDPDAPFARTPQVADVVRFSGVLVGAWQYEAADFAPDREGGAFVFQPEVAVAVGDAGEVRARFGFAAGDGVIPGSPFSVAAPWAADVEEGVRDINGRDRDTLLVAEYTHRFVQDDDRALSVTAGILDASEFVDENAYANDELRQFLNSAFVNDPIGFTPSYDTGVAATLRQGVWSAAAVLSRVGMNTDGSTWSFFGGQVGYHFGGRSQAGAVRLLVTGTSEDFRDRSDTTDEARFGASVSADHLIVDGVGVFGRVGWQDDAAAVDFDFAASGGVVLSGTPWGREHDVVGLGCAWLDGGNGAFDDGFVAEAYAAAELTSNLTFTVDAQYLHESLVIGTDLAGWIFGARMTLLF